MSPVFWLLVVAVVASAALGCTYWLRHPRDVDHEPAPPTDPWDYDRDDPFKYVPPPSSRVGPP